MSHRIEDWEYEYDEPAAPAPASSNVAEVPADQSLTPYHPVSKACNPNGYLEDTCKYGNGKYPRLLDDDVNDHCPAHCVKSRMRYDHCGCNSKWCAGRFKLQDPSSPPEYNANPSYTEAFKVPNPYPSPEYNANPTYTAALDVPNPYPNPVTPPNDTKTTYDSLNIDLVGWKDVQI